jgi:N-acyl amino acid synthase of PEP-CTERM/exosortase system
MTTRLHTDTGASSASQRYARLLEDFDFQLAASQKQRLEVYHLRHQVYCQEIGYTPPDGGADEIEVDPHDRHAVHCLLRHRRTGLAAGCFRLVFPDPTAPGASMRLPLQEYGGRSLTHAHLHPSRLPFHEICEVSRLATAREFRHHPVGYETLSADTPHEHFSDEERRLFPLITGAVFLATHALVELAGRRHIFAMMQPKLPRLLARSGFHFQLIGKPIELHGERSAYYIDNQVAEAEMQDALRPFYRCIKEVLSPQLACALPPPSRIAIPS